MENLDGGSPNETVTEAEVQPENPVVETEEVDYKKAYEEAMKKAEGALKKVHKLTARNYELADGQKDILDQLTELRAKEVEPEKTRADFSTDDEYVDYRSVKVAEKLLADRDAQGKLEYQEQLDRQAQEKNWAQKMEQAKGRYADFDQALQGTEVPLTQLVIDAVKRSELGGDIVYTMAKDPEFAQKLTQLPPEQLDREILKKEILLQMPAPQITNAPQATPDVQGKPHHGQKDYSQETTAEFMARRNRELGRT
jgi:hypothetical protein